MIRYVFSDSPVTIKNAGKANPQSIGEALAKIAAANDGRLEPQKIVDAAKTDKKLHPHFEWSDKKAANSWRLDQARELVRCIHVESSDTDSGKARAFLSVNDAGGTAYRSLGEILSSKDLQSRLLAQAERDLLAFEDRYKSLSDICSLIRQARERVTDRRVGNRDQASA